MAIQGTQVPIHTLFLYFFDFSIFIFLFLYKTKLKTNKQKYVKQNTQSIKTRCKSMRKEEKEERSLHGDYTNVLV